MAVDCAAISTTLHRERALRPREGRLHRRGRSEARAASSAPTAARCSSTRSASCRSTLQAKLLRVLESARSERVGGDRDAARSTSASSRRPTATSARGRRGHVPRGPLLPAGGRHAADPAAPRPPGGRPAPGSASSGADGSAKLEAAPRSRTRALAALSTHPWPGNVRELRNAVHRAYVLSETQVIGERIVNAVIGKPGASTIAPACRSTTTRPRPAWPRSGSTSRRSWAWRTTSSPPRPLTRRSRRPRGPGR